MNDGNIPEVSEFGSVDPAPPSNEKDVETLKQVLNDETEQCLSSQTGDRVKDAKFSRFFTNL